MARAHLFRPVTDEAGNLLYGATVTVNRADATAPLDQTIYAGPLSNAAALPNPFNIDGGYVDIWLDTPERVGLLISSTGRDPVSVFLDVNPPAQEVMRTVYPLIITNQPTAGQVLVGLDGQSAHWQPPPVAPASGTAPAHQHDGTGTNSTALGTGASASVDGSTAIGDSSNASGIDSTAFGFQAVASGARSTAAGANASSSADDGTAVGSTASAVSGGTAVGSGAAASGARSSAIGINAHASGAGAVAVGSSASAQGVDSVAFGESAVAAGDNSAAFGNGASAPHNRSVAVGAGAATTADDQVALGGVGSTVVVLGELLAQGNAQVGGNGDLVGFFGAAGVAKQTVTGAGVGPGPLKDLLTYLASLGLIIDNTTA